MPQDQRDRRQFARQSVMLPCRVDGVATSGTMQVTDLSAGGCFIATRESVAAGSDVTIRAKFAGVELALTGRVVHVRPGSGFAIEFGNLPPDTRYMLEHFLTRAPAPSY
jgi:PilZ domain-containing protein